MAPEVIPINFDGHYDSKCDIWSLGVTLYYILTGDLPFLGFTRGQIFKKINNVEFKMPKTFSKELKDLLHRMLTKDPKERISAAQIVQHKWITEAKTNSGIFTSLIIGGQIKNILGNIEKH